jgi:glyoxylase-like metal-dependent hydrolase (beta-lactamase superfamily II)
VRVGDVELAIVSAGRWWLDAGGHFGVVPRVLWEPLITVDERHRVPMALNCLLIQSDRTTILVDTGLGTKLSHKEQDWYGLDSEGGLLQELDRLDVAPQDVDIVINTHLHSDHGGGNTIFDRHGQPRPTFPRAEYWVQRLEWSDAVHPNERTTRTYLPQNLQPLEESGQLRLLEGDTRVTNEVRCLVTPGHTRAHQSVVIESNGKQALYLGDLAPWKENIEKLTWTSAADVTPLENLETKRAIRPWLVEERVLLLFEHDPRIAAGYLHLRGDHYEVEPVEI